MEKVNDSIMATETVRTPVSTFPHHGIARRVLSVHDMIPSTSSTPGQVFRVKDPKSAADAWIYPQEYSIDVLLKVGEKDLVSPPEALLEKMEIAVQEQEDATFLFLLSNARFERNTTKGINGSNLQKLVQRAENLVVNTTQHLDPVIRLALAECGYTGRIEFNGRRVPVWQIVMPDQPAWIAACPAPQDVGAMAMYGTEISSDSNQMLHQKSGRAMVVFSGNVEFLEA